MMGTQARICFCPKDAEGALALLQEADAPPAGTSIQNKVIGVAGYCCAATGESRPINARPMSCPAVQDL